MKKANLLINRLSRGSPSTWFRRTQTVCIRLKSGKASISKKPNFLTNKFNFYDCKKREVLKDFGNSFDF